MLTARNRIALAALALALLPLAPADAGSPETCFGLPATFVGTNRADTVALGYENNVAVMKGGNDFVRIDEDTDSHVFVCTGDGNDVILGNPRKLHGGSGSDKWTWTSKCSTYSPDRIFKVEEIRFEGCTE